MQMTSLDLEGAIHVSIACVHRASSPIPQVSWRVPLYLIYETSQNCVSSTEVLGVAEGPGPVATCTEPGTKKEEDSN